MDKLVTAIGAMVIVVGTIFGMSLISGTLLYCVYDHIHALFPTAATRGIIAQHLSWWDSVCVSWIANCLIKSSLTTTKKND